MKKFQLTITAFLFLANLTSAVLPQRMLVEDRNTIVVAIAGQSNASGRGGMPGGVLPVDPLMQVLGDDYRWYAGREPTDQRGSFAVDSVNYDEPMGYSAGFAIAQRLHFYYPDVPVAVVNCSKGDTTILQWAPSTDAGTLYGACLKKIYAGMSKGDLAFLFFYQGENDTNELAAERAPLWDTYFGEIVEQLHNDFRQDLPIVFAQIGSTTKTTQPYWSVVQERQAAFTAEYVTMIVTSDLPIRTDGVHLTKAAQDEVGQRVVDAYCSLVGCMSPE